MIVAITDGNWRLTRAALASTGERFADLVSAADPSAAATRHWSVADTVAHVATLTQACAAMSGAATPPVRDLGDLMRRTTIDTVADLNEVVLGQFTERNPDTLAARIRSDIGLILDATGGADPAGAVPWLGDSRVPLAGILAHLLNELQIHGRDIARTVRARWPVPPREAGMFFELFLIGVTHYGYGRLLDGHGPWPRRRVAVEFASPYTTPRAIVLDNGLVTVERPGGAADTRVLFDPVTLNLMLFGRISKARAALTGHVVVRGPRPWLLPAFFRIMRLPS
ncbi:maleylpyruvate isomerase N-terminal domain-containing protein [Nonomuraea sp. NPDC047897]|uniref:maleylpyruvate isomerase N-terminal domain-containing protein n=1 Tax=Nonomuraea sp. NPDC047897 TaxID=3364346 RepID=UPI00371E7739